MATYDPEKFILKSGGTITIRHCEPEFAKIFPSFSDQLANETTHTSHYKGREIIIDEIENKWKIALNSQTQLELGGFDENRLIAQISLRKPHPNHPWTQHIGEFGMGILQEYWSQGLGSRMLQIIEDISKKMNIYRLEGRVRSENYRGIDLYLRHGYEIEGMKKHAAFLNGKFQNEYYIAKILNDQSH